MKVPTNAYTIKDLLRLYTKWAFHKCFLLLFAVAVSQDQLWRSIFIVNNKQFHLCFKYNK